MDKNICILGSAILVVDQFLKIFISSYLSLGESIIVIKDFFSLKYVNNYGGAWSIFNNKVILLVIITFIILFILFQYMKKFKENIRNAVAFGLLFGGIIGNLVDRICFGFVKDYLAFNIFGYNFPVFNLADIAIFLGVVILIIGILKGEDKNEVKSN